MPRRACASSGSSDELHDSIRRREGVEMDVPGLVRDGLVDDLEGPADTDQPRSHVPEPGKGAVVVAAALADPHTGAVDGNQRDEHDVGIDLLRLVRRLDSAD